VLIYKLHSLYNYVNRYYLYIPLGMILYLPIYMGVYTGDIITVLYMSSIILTYNITYNIIRMIISNSSNSSKYIQRNNK
jgi:hypothetical protein